MYECVIVNDRLKCQLSGGTLQGFGSPINPIKPHLCCVVNRSETPYPLHMCSVKFNVLKFFSKHSPKPISMIYSQSSCAYLIAELYSLDMLDGSKYRVWSRMRSWWHCQSAI